MTGTLTPGKQFASTEAVTIDKLNQLGQGTISFTGQVVNSDLSSAAVTAAKTRADNYFYADGTTVNGAGASATIKYTLAWTTNTAPSSLSTGLVVAWKANTDCTGTVSADVGVGGEKVILKNKTESLGIGDIINGQIVEMRYDGTNWQMISEVTLTDSFRSTTTGASATYAAIISPPGGANNVTLTQLSGRPIYLKLHQASAGVDTLAITVGTAAALTAKPLRKSATAAWGAGDYTTNQEVIVIYESTTDSFQCQTPPSTVITPVAVVGDSRNLVIKNNAVSPTFKVDIIADSVVLQASTTGGFFPANSVSVTLDLTTTGLNGLDTGSLVGTWYYVYLISDGTNIRGIATSNVFPSAPNPIPSGYVYKALVGVIYNTGVGSNLKTFLIQGRNAYQAEATVISGKADTAAYTLISGAELVTFQTLVPAVAKSALLSAGATANPEVLWQLAADTNGLGACNFWSNSGGTILGTLRGGSTAYVPLGGTQTFAYKVKNSSGTGNAITCSGFTF